MRSLLCLQMLNHVKGVGGDVIELGVAFGATSLTLAFWMAEMTPAKRLYACDTFSGLPITEGTLNAGEFNYGDSFQRVVSCLPLGNITVVKGLIEETLPAQLSDLRFCFAWLDLDLYAPTSFAARWLTDRIAPGGVIGFHDYRFERTPGIQKVVDYEIDREKFDLVLSDWTCVYFQRRG